MEKVSDRGSAKVAPDEFHYFCRFSGRHAIFIYTSLETHPP
jgi:hypothetical protein